MTTEAKHQMLVGETRAKFPYLIHISHSLGDWYYCNCDKEISYAGKTYKPAVFSIAAPEETSSSIKNTSLSLSVVDTEEDWIANIRNAGNERFKFEFSAMIYYERDSGEPLLEELESNSFMLTSASWNDLTVNWTVVFDENMSINVPCDIAGSANMPACA